jgi:hypothetical protein
MIPLGEVLFPFKEIAAGLPRRRAGKPAWAATLHRWRTKGFRGVRLDAVRIGSVWCTSWAALERFREGVNRTRAGKFLDTGLAPRRPQTREARTYRGLRIEGSRV